MHIFEDLVKSYYKILSDIDEARISGIISEDACNFIKATTIVAYRLDLKAALRQNSILDELSEKE